MNLRPSDSPLRASGKGFGFMSKNKEQKEYERGFEGESWMQSGRQIDFTS